MSPIKSHQRHPSTTPLNPLLSTQNIQDHSVYSSPDEDYIEQDSLHHIHLQHTLTESTHLIKPLQAKISQLEELILTKTTHINQLESEQVDLQGLIEERQFRIDQLEEQIYNIDQYAGVSFANDSFGGVGSGIEFGSFMGRNLLDDLNGVSIHPAIDQYQQTFIDTNENGCQVGCLGVERFTQTNHILVTSTSIETLSNHPNEIKYKDVLSRNEIESIQLEESGSIVSIEDKSEKISLPHTEITTEPNLSIDLSTIPIEPIITTTNTNTFTALPMTDSNTLFQMLKTMNSSTLLEKWMSGLPILPNTPNIPNIKSNITKNDKDNTDLESGRTSLFHLAQTTIGTWVFIIKAYFYFILIF